MNASINQKESLIDVMREESKNTSHEVLISEDRQNSETNDESIDHNETIQLKIERVKSNAINNSFSLKTNACNVSPSAIKKSWIHYLNPFSWGSIPPVPTERTKSKECSAGYLSLLYFQWITPLMNVGYKRQLQECDIWTINPIWSTDTVTTKLQANFENRVTRGYKNALLFALYDTFKKEFILGGIFQLSASILQALTPFTLRYLIQYAQDAFDTQNKSPASPSIGIGLAFVFGITLMQMLQSLQTNHFIYRGMTVGGGSRGALMSLIFDKAMKISSRAKAGHRVTSSKIENDEEFCDENDQKKKSKHRYSNYDEKFKSRDSIGWSNGRVMSLMSVDSNRVDQASTLFHMIWTAPISCMLTLVLLFINMTYSALTGFALLVLGLLLVTKTIKSLFARRKRINKITDQRITLTQEIMNAVKFVKLYGWESAFLNKLQLVREREIHAIQILMTIRNAMNTISMTLPIFASMLTFTTYSLTNHPLEPARVFSSLALFNSLRMPLNLLPPVVSRATDAFSSLIRIQEYLLSEETQEMAPIDLRAEMALELKNTEYTWEINATQETVPQKPKVIETKSQVSSDFPNKKPYPFKLLGINLTIGRNELVAVIGGVGSGKTSLLAAIASDMRKTKGEFKLGATRAFCPQSAWIQNATIRDNILFGKEMQEDWYHQVISACALGPDLEMLTLGDNTEIGERGVTLSGGQKQRINIARAIYFDADFILMDDPLSAVDAHVGRQIFDNAILKLLKTKARILATHQCWVLSHCDRIVWMEEGRIRTVDTFENLMRHDTEFQILMKNTAVENGTSDVVKHQRKMETVFQLKLKPENTAELMQSEERPLGSVPWSVYLDYINASGSILNVIIVFILLIASQCTNIITSLWLSWWSSDYFGYKTGIYIGLYVTLGVSQALLTFFYSLALTIIGTVSSKRMMNHAITRVLRAPMSFFDTTPLGRITNRFSRDVDIMDNELTEAIRMFFLTVVMILTVFCLIIIYLPYFAIALFPLCVFLIFSSDYYRASARQLNRIESVLRSHVFAKFSEGLSGTASIRAYGLQDRFITQIHSKIDEMNSVYYLTFATQRWVSTRLDIIGNLLVFVTGILVVTSRFNIKPSIAGLVLSYVVSIVQMIQFSIRQLADMETGMNATERIHHYGTCLEEEAPLHTIKIRKTWPESGEINFKNVYMRYRTDLPFVISDFNMNIRSGEHIGIVGRTGAGKSSIMLTLFRLVELSAGSIIIDGLNISTIGLHELRSRLSIIPQDPTLFNGSIRSNLDPFSEFTDPELWSALYQSNLASKSTQKDEKSLDRIQLDTTVNDEGSNFSLGQRQLMALARALVRGSQIIVCDEATSSIDMETDLKIQNTMATAFKGKTLLCIAHRLKTIIKYDRICVLDHGRIVELDTPRQLWEKGYIFRSMCDKSGIREEDL